MTPSGAQQWMEYCATMIGCPLALLLGGLLQVRSLLAHRVALWICPVMVAALLVRAYSTALFLAGLSEQDVGFASILVPIVIVPSVLLATALVYLFLTLRLQPSCERRSPTAPRPR